MKPGSAPCAWRAGPALGRFGRLVALRVGLHAAAFTGAGLLLFFVFDLVEAANADLGVLEGLRRSAATLPDVALRVGKLALLLGGLTAGRSVIRSRELVAWSSAGGHPAALLAASLALGAAAGALCMTVPRVQDTRAEPAERSEGRTGALAARIAEPRSGSGFVPSTSRALPDSTPWLRQANRWLKLTGVSPDGRRLGRVEVLRVLRGRLTDRETAEDVLWTGAGWHAARWTRWRLTERAVRTATAAWVPLPLPVDPRAARTLAGASSDDPAATARVQRRFGLPYHRPLFAAWRRWSDPVVWSVMAALGLGLALIIRVRAAGLTGPTAVVGLGFVLHTAEELTAAGVDVGLVGPFAGAWATPGLAALATVAVWRTAVARGIRD